jgi:deoxyinosine 3'endonuclease (endonuclease V)
LIIIDGYVFLDDNQKAGLGYHLYKSLEDDIPVIGVAKTAFKDNKALVAEVYRGISRKPLFVTSIGIELKDAAENIRNMHGGFRMPGLLKLLDTHTKNNGILL